MARKPSARVVLHRATLDAITLGAADGLFELSQEIIEAAAQRAPDSPYDPYPSGEGLPRQGGALAYVAGGKTAGWSQRGGQPKKPRALRAASRTGLLVVGGFGFPARFAELGTINHPGQPFLAPTLADMEPGLPDAVARGVRARLAGAA